MSSGSAPWQPRRTSGPPPGCRQQTRLVIAPRLYGIAGSGPQAAGSETARPSSLTAARCPRPAAPFSEGASPRSSTPRQRQVPGSTAPIGRAGRGRPATARQVAANRTCQYTGCRAGSGAVATERRRAASMIWFAMATSTSRSSSRYRPPLLVAIVFSEARSRADVMIGCSGLATRFGSGMTPPCSGADADDEDRDVAGARQLQRILDHAAEGLAVGEQHELLRVRRLAAQLLVLLDQPQTPLDAERDVRVPARVVLEAERRAVRR